jgi:membrane protein implicated in regulation of membrane protease activity
MAKEVSNFTVKYGFRAMVPLSIILIFALFLLIEYLSSGRNDSLLLALSIVFFLTDALLFIGFTITISTRITKKYFHPETLVGRTGRVINGRPANNLGTVTVMNEDWSFICDSDTNDNDIVEVIEVMDDKVTLKVRKTS